MQSIYFTDAQWLIVFGLASAVLSVVAFFPYIRDTLSQTSQPQRASWLIWSVLASIAFVAQVHEGAQVTLWFAGAQAAMTIIVFILSVRHGKGPFVSRPDERFLWLAGMGLVIWYFTNTAAYALAMTITISMLGGVLTTVKAYREPSTETLSKWGVSAVASVFAIAAAPVWDPVILAYPIYILTLNLMIFAAILLGRRTPRNQPAWHEGTV